MACPVLWWGTRENQLELREEKASEVDPGSVIPLCRELCDRFAQDVRANQAGPPGCGASTRRQTFVT